MSQKPIILTLLLALLAWTVPQNQACHTASLPDTDELTQGPYWIDPELNRSNITEGQPGTPFTLVLRVWNKTQVEAACAAAYATTGNDTNQPIQDGVGTLAGVQVDIWYANASGHYSGFSAEGTAGQTWLRGYQLTNASGYVTFQSIFPGWYTSRTTHIHVRIRLFNNGTQTYDDTTQLFFDDTLSDSIYASNSLYSHGSGRDTHNSGDGIYQSVMQMNVTGSAAAGYQSVFDLYYPFVTTSGTGTGGSGSGSGSGNQPTPPSGGGGNPPTPTTATATTAVPTTLAPTTATPTTQATDAPTTTAPTVNYSSSSSSSTGVGNTASSRVMSIMSPLAVAVLALLSIVVSL